MHDPTIMHFHSLLCHNGPVQSRLVLVGNADHLPAPPGTSSRTPIHERTYAAGNDVDQRDCWLHSRTADYEGNVGDKGTILPLTAASHGF